MTILGGGENVQRTYRYDIAGAPSPSTLPSGYFYPGDPACDSQNRALWVCVPLLSQPIRPEECPLFPLRPAAPAAAPVNLPGGSPLLWSM
jgi:hypothetical protein